MLHIYQRFLCILNWHCFWNKQNFGFHNQHRCVWRNNKSRSRHNSVQWYIIELIQMFLCFFWQIAAFVWFWSKFSNVIFDDNQRISSWTVTSWPNKSCTFASSADLLFVFCNSNYFCAAETITYFFGTDIHATSKFLRSYYVKLQHPNYLAHQINLC